MKTSPTQRSLKYLRGLGYKVAVVEKWVQYPPPGHRVDLFGFIDLLAVKEGETLAVQSTTGSNLAARVHKIEDDPTLQENIAAVRGANWKIVIHGWRKLASTGRWELREEDVS